MEPLSLEGQGVVLRIDGAELSAPLISLGFAPVSREAYDSTHLKTERAKTYAPGKLNDRGSLEAVIDHDPQGLRLTLYPPGSITVIYPLRPGQTEPDRRDLYGFIERQGAEEMRTDQRAVTRLLIRLTDPQMRFNGYITSTYTSTWTGTVWGTPVLVGSTVVSVLPVGINTWTVPSVASTVATGTFTGAAGTGDFNGILGVVPPAPVLPLPNALPGPSCTGAVLRVSISGSSIAGVNGVHDLPWQGTYYGRISPTVTIASCSGAAHCFSGPFDYFGVSLSGAPTTSYSPSTAVTGGGTGLVPRPATSGGYCDANRWYGSGDGAEFTIISYL